MKQATYILTDENGIHARPAGVITQMAKRSLSSITLRIRENGRTADAGKLFSVMALGGHAGETLEITDYSPEIDTELKIVCFPTFPGHCGCMLFDRRRIQTVQGSTSGDNLTKS